MVLGTSSLTTHSQDQNQSRHAHLKPRACSCPGFNINNINIDPSSTLRISLTISTSPCTIPQHRPILLPSGVVSTSPPYPPLSNVRPEFLPHRPTFLPAATPHAPSVKDKEKGRHAALIAHLCAELREEGGSWEDVVRECRRGRGGYQRS